MDAIGARPMLLKQANLSVIRRALKNKGTATRLEIADETGISFTTVRTLLGEMEANGEIQSAGYDVSSGGRRAERYRFLPNRYYGAAFCIVGNQIDALTVNLCGEIVDRTTISAYGGNYQSKISEYIEELMREKEIKAIGIGVPGVADGAAYWKKDPVDGMLHRIEIGSALESKFGLPVVVENDINATAIGFGRCYEREFPEEKSENTNMAFLHFEKGCISGGFISEGHVIRGWNQFAGELGLIPISEDQTLDECLAQSMDDNHFIDRAIQIIAWICGILNPQYIALGGPAMRKSCISLIGDGLSSLLPSHMVAEILYAPDVRHDFHDGMACLTAARIFADVQIRKE